jgi:hypothetical protein
MYTTAFPIETNLVLIKIGLLYEISTLPQTAQLLLIKNPTNVVWFNFSDAKTTQQSVSKYLSKQNKTWKTQTRFPALLQMKTEIHYPAPASQ